MMFVVLACDTAAPTDPEPGSRKVAVAGVIEPAAVTEATTPKATQTRMAVERDERAGWLMLVFMVLSFAWMWV